MVDEKGYEPVHESLSNTKNSRALGVSPTIAPRAASQQWAVDGRPPPPAWTSPPSMRADQDLRRTKSPSSQRVPRRRERRPHQGTAPPAWAPDSRGKWLRLPRPLPGGAKPRVVVAHVSAKRNATGDAKCQWEQVLQRVQLRELQHVVRVAERVKLVRTTHLAAVSDPSNAAPLYNHAALDALDTQLDTMGCLEWRELYDDEPVPAVSIRRTPAHRLSTELRAVRAQALDIHRELPKKEQRFLNRNCSEDIRSMRKQRDQVGRELQRVVTRAEDYVKPPRRPEKTQPATQARRKRRQAARVQWTFTEVPSPH